MVHRDRSRARCRSGSVRTPGTARGLTLAAALTAVIVAGCSADDAPPATGEARPLTVEQSVLLAETLVRTAEAGGATFVALSEDRTTGRAIGLEGEVDWTRLEGRARLEGYADAFGPVTEVAWSRAGIAERRPEQGHLLVERGEAPNTFFLRAADLQQSVLDRVITLVMALAAEQPEDAAQLRAQPAAALLRTDTLRGTDVLVMRYSARAIYWVDAATGTLLRFEGIDASGVNPIVVDLIELGSREVAMPTVSRSPLEVRR